jgi:hypothetical protein
MVAVAVAQMAVKNLEHLVVQAVAQHSGLLMVQQVYLVKVTMVVLLVTFHPQNYQHQVAVVLVQLVAVPLELLLETVAQV